MTHQRRQFINILIAISLLVILLQAMPQNGPAIKFFVGDTALDEKDGVDAKDLAQLKIKIVTDDKSYTINKWRLYIRRSTELGLPREGSGEELHLHNAVVQSGDVVVVELEPLTHIDVSGKKEKVTPSTEMKYISIKIK